MDEFILSEIDLKILQKSKVVLLNIPTDNLNLTWKNNISGP